MSAQREDFEAEARLHLMNLERRVDGDYLSGLAAMAWQFWQAAQAAMQAELVQLRGFAADVMEAWPEDGLDGGELQGIAEDHGLLTLGIAHQPCGEVCMCAEYAATAEFIAGVECYRKSKVLLDAEMARNGGKS